MDCLGYYSLQLPGEVEYAVQQPRFNRDWNPQFGDGLVVWGTEFYVDSRVEISSAATQSDLDALALSKNNEQQKSKDELLRKAKLFDDLPDTQARLQKQAKDIGFFEAFNRQHAYATYGNIGMTLQALVAGRIVTTYRPINGTPEQTIDALLKSYRPRAPFEVPNEPGVCLPYAFMTHEAKPADVGVSIRLTDRPYIVIYLHDQPVDTSEQAPANAAAFINKAIHPGNSFYASESTAPLDGRLRSFDKVTIDGRKGVGVFALVTRKRMGGAEAVHNEANKDQDWAYIAYVPGDKKAPPGASSDLTFRVERFGRFAKQPMTEKEFRAMVKTVAESIKRRPGAWRQQ
jgi:hypothetical protein